MKRAVPALAAALALALAACEPPPSARGTPAPAAAPPVQVAEARRAAVPETIRAVGSLEPWERVPVSPEIGGVVAEIGADLGDAVRAGAVLLRLEDRELKLQVEAAEAALAEAAAVLEQARAAYRRARTLARDGLVSRDALDRARSRWQVAAATRVAAAKRLALARKHLSDAVLRAPVSGRVAARYATVGAYVAPYRPAFELVVTDPLKLRVTVPGWLSRKMRPGLDVHLTVVGASDRVAGAVSRVASDVDPETRTLLVEATVPNPTGRLKPGEFAQATIELGRRTAVVVPRAALTTFAGVQRVFVVGPDDRVEMRTVEADRDLGAEVVLRRGVRAGERVAVTQLERLAPGMRVRPVARDDTG